MKTYDAIIIGGGASGIVAAITAARRGKNVAIIEKNSKLGRKILVTGNGRCNISNKYSTEDQKDAIHYFGKNPKFVLGVLNEHGYQSTKSFFQELGIEFKEEDNGRMFPVSNQAQSVLDVLEYELSRLNIKIIYSNTPKSIEYNKQYHVTLQDGNQLATRKLIIATGGKTYPKFGTTGDGYLIAQQFGHTLVDTFPVYSGLLIKSPIFQKLQGVKTEVGVKAYSNDKLIIENEGTIMFAHYGLSAPGVLEISREIANEVRLKGNKVTVEINLLPFVEEQKIDQFLVNRWQKNPQKSLGFSFEGLLPKKIAPAFLETEGIDPTTKVSEISKELRKRIITVLTQYQFEVEDVKDFNEAHFTAGGVNTKEVNPKTLESNKQKGLYFCGEVLDIDGECGGYNLQWAWSSGTVVGLNI